MGNLKDRLAQIKAGGFTGEKIKSDLHKVLTEEWFYDFIVDQVEKGNISADSATMQVFFIIKRQPECTSLTDTSDQLVYALQTHEDIETNFHKTREMTFGDVYNDYNSQYIDLAIKSTVEEIINSFEDIINPEISLLVSVTPASTYCKTIRIVFKSPLQNRG